MGSLCSEAFVSEPFLQRKKHSSVRPRARRGEERERGWGWKIAEEGRGEGQSFLMRMVYERDALGRSSHLLMGPAEHLGVRSRRQKQTFATARKHTNSAINTP